MAQIYNSNSNVNKTRYYKDLDNKVYKCIAVGFDKNTDRELCALREVKTGLIWFMPLSELKARKLVDGIPTHVYAKVFDYIEEDTNYGKDFERARGYGERDRQAPRYANDSRLGYVQRPNDRYNREDR